MLLLCVVPGVAAQSINVSPTIEVGGDGNNVGTLLIGLRVRLTVVGDLDVFGVAGERIFIEPCDEGRQDCGSFAPLMIVGAGLDAGEALGARWGVILGGGLTSRYDWSPLVRTGLRFELGAWAVEAGVERVYREQLRDLDMVFLSLSR